MVTVPALMPVTMPAADTVAFVLLALHVPPADATASVIVLPAHTDVGPVIGPAAPGPALTVTGSELVHPVPSM